MFCQGFPFDDGVDREGSAGGSRSNLQAHLADLAARHPELADSLVGLFPEEQLTEARENKQKSELFTKDSQPHTTEVTYVIKKTKKKINVLYE